MSSSPKSVRLSLIQTGFVITRHCVEEIVILTLSVQKCFNSPANLLKFSTNGGLPNRTDPLNSASPPARNFSQWLQRLPKERIFIGLMTSDRKLKASEEGSKCRALSAPSGPLGSNFSQHGPTTRPSVERTADKAFMLSDRVIGYPTTSPPRALGAIA